MERTLEQAKVTVDSGYDAVWFGQHYISEGKNHFQPLPLLSRVAGFAGEADLGTSIFLLPLHNPIAVAENFATANTLFSGKLLFGVALGYKPEEFDSFGVDIDDRVGRFVEGIQLLRKLWTEENVTYSGNYFQVDDITIDPRPGDDFELWVGGNADKSVERAGRMGDGWIISARTTFEEAERLSSIYERAAERSDRPNAGIAMNREVFVADSTDEAVERVMPMMKDRAAQWLERGAQDTAEQVDDLDEQVYDMLEERFVGSPEECIDRIANVHERAGVEHLIAMYNWRQLPQQRVLDSITRFGDEVIPYFEDEYADV
jgi:alkanesulfonate monooxygenase SsuD/methylene tetrahydromethanopterin reductase-like flavin-dependent oxidoreductase (luciferase family)